MYRRYSTPQSHQFKSRTLPLHQSAWCSGADSPILPRVRVERWDIKVTWSYLPPVSNFTNCNDSLQSFNGNQTSVTSRYLCLCVCVCVCVFYKGELGLSLSTSSGHWDACIPHSCCIVVSSKILPPLTQRQFPRTLEGFPVPRHNGEGDRIKQCSGFWEGKVTVSATVQRWWAQSVWCGHVLLTHLFRLPMNNARATDCTCYKLHGAWVIAVESLTVLM